MSEIHRLQKQLASGRITRREFMSRMAAIGATAAAPASLFSSRAMAQPKKGGHFKIGIGAGSTTDSLDPATTLDTYMQTIDHAIYSYVAVVDNDGNAVPELAESIEPSPDAKSWTCIRTRQSCATRSYTDRTRFCPWNGVLRAGRWTSARSAPSGTCTSRASSGSTTRSRRPR